jgi:hypothetical protein
MKVFCVPSHHSICADPLSKQGVLLVPEMFAKGIWYPGGGRGCSESPKEFWEEFRLSRSENEQEYRAALQALAEVVPHNAAAYQAVVSMRWCSMTGRLVIAKRSWLSIFSDDIQVVSYSHKGERHDAMRRFLEVFEEPVLDQAIWRTRFQDDIKDFWEKKLAASRRSASGASKTKSRALLELGQATPA